MDAEETLIDWRGLGYEASSENPREDRIVQAALPLAREGSFNALSQVHVGDATISPSMGRQVFTVRGRVAWPDGAPVADAYVAVVDADPDLDDLIGAGAVASDGSFRLSFTAEAFNQEASEAETTPDLYLVVSRPSWLAGPGSTALQPVLRHDVGKLAFASAAREEDLGTIVVAPPTVAFLPGAPLRVAPGRGKIVKRLRLDEEIVDLAVREIAPLVEHLTGWSNLRDGVELRIVDAYRDELRARIQQELGGHALDSTQLALIETAMSHCDATVVASWHPEERVVLLNRTLIEEQGFDYLKVTIGHELVHVGQTRVLPSLAARLRRARVERLETVLAGRSLPRARMRDAVQLLTNIEGYAHYIETRWLRQIYTHTAHLPRPTSEADAYFRNLAAPETPAASDAVEPEPATMSVPDMLDDLFGNKAAQYLFGENFYRLRATGDRPAPFDPDLRCDESNLEEVLGALMLYRSEMPKPA
ncbi:MAG: carboxypeptidase regulatory-like domain-containing protein [Polyangiaceae bacterium]|nr:carboxypeptidase regulatory-like domain-containing protein [Polyangiaceae bacterium]